MPWVRAIVAAYKQSGVLQRVVSGAMFLSPMLSLTPLELPQIRGFRLSAAPWCDFLILYFQYNLSVATQSLGAPRLRATSHLFAIHVGRRHEIRKSSPGLGSN